ncbi:MAG: hypothetical protein KDC04_00325 [Saprospiraceae bacterium]|nr:hypothetical protein [Saprospiraceae bacterium]MCB9310895.1 hypothetical protein [Lewinellaceae bacterium]
MRPTLAKFLIFLQLTSISPMKEMVKLPLLFVHFTNHVSEGEGMSISEFISMHYLANPVIDDDYLQDRQLPFKSVDFSQMPIFIIQDSPVFELTHVSEIFFFDSITESAEKPFSNLLQLGVFRPPQLV